LLLSKAYGRAQLEDDVAMTPEHIFRIASHSKTFTATAIMQLVEQGRLRLDDRASASLPWLSSEATIRQLLNHAAGIIRDGRDSDFWQTDRHFPDRDELRAIASDGIVFEPNRTFKYSNIGFGVLGLVIEAVTGTTYNAHVTEHIVQRLGLVDTGPEVDPLRADRLVTGYSRARLGVPRQPFPLMIDTGALSPATGFYSTAGELSAYGTAHCFGDERLLTDASKREMQHAYWSVGQADEGYGLGFSVRKVGNRQLIGHGGGFPGHSTSTLIDPTDRLVVVVLSNTNASDGLAAPLAVNVVKILDCALACARDTGQPTPDMPLERFTGRFASAWGVTDIVAFGNTLKAVSPEADSPVDLTTSLEVVDENMLRIAVTSGYASPGESVPFERDATGRITRVRLGGGSSYPVDIFRQRFATAR
jgi:CubicO group peptidase (beta-lactamase class C family)